MKLLEVPFEDLFFDLIYEGENEDEGYGKLDQRLYPGAGDTHNRLLIEVDEETNQVVGLYSFDCNNSELKTKLDINKIHPLEISYLFEGALGKRNSHEVLDYLLTEGRICKEYYQK